MKRIYKRIEVASSEILLTLALFSDVGGAESVDAADLDRLEAQLSRPNYTGAEQLLVANVQRSHLEITNEGNVLAVLHRLKRGENIFVCKARYGTNISVQLTIDFVVTDPNETTPVEISEDVVLVESIGDGGGGQFPTDYAKQGTDPNATLTDTQAYAQSAASDAGAAKVAAQALSPVALAADAYNTGKVELAANITAKGVEASASETLPQLAQKVTAIAQQPIILSPSEVGDMYAVQQFGSLTTPNYWNLYEVLNTLLNDGRLLNYGGILLAEYYKGYDSITLSGVGAGGAYVVSDMENGVFKMYTEDTTHVWSTEFDGKGNRWVAYCFADEYHDFQITDTNTSPRSIFIGRKVGTITSLVANRCSQVVVPDGNELVFFDANTSNNFGRVAIFRNIGNIRFGIKSSTELFYAEVNNETLGNIIAEGSTNVTMGAIIIKAKDASIPYLGPGAIVGSGNEAHLTVGIIYIDGIVQLETGEARFIRATKCDRVIIDGFKTFSRHDTYLFQYCNFKRLEILSFETCREGAFTYNTIINSLYLGYEENDKNKSVILRTASGDPECTDVELKDGYCKNLSISGFTSSLTEANMYAHILQRLKQDEPDCGDGVTITLGQANLDKLTSEESIALLDDLTNIYGYTFA